MQRSVNATAAVLLALGLPQLSPRAGTFTANFNDGAVPAEITLAAPAKVVATGGVGGTGYLSITDAAGSLSGSAAIADIDNGEVVGGFRATMKIRIGNGSGRPADGFSLSFGSDVQDSGGGEEGSGTGLRVILDTYDNGSGEAPALDIAWGGTVFAHTLWAGATSIPIPQQIDPATGGVASLQTGSEFADLIVDLHPTGTLDVVYKGITVYTNLVVPAYTPTAGHFVLSARTGGEFETHWVDDISITTVPAITGAASIATQPADTSAPERGSATFTVVPGGAPPHTFQWYTNGVAVTDATGASLTLSGLTMDLNNLKVKVNVANAEGNLDSREANLTVVPDTLAPTVLKAQSSDSFTDVTILFSEDLDPVSAANKDNYSIAGLAITDASLVGTRGVKLTTATQAQGTAYTVTINNVKDTAATPNSVAANTTATFTSFARQLGGLRMDVFLLPELGGATDVASLLGSDKFVNNAPDETYYVRQFSSRPIYGGGTIDQYGGRLAGWIKPTETADYNFFIRSDDLSQLFLSEDEDPTKKVMIAEVTACCGAFHEPDAGQPDTSAAIHLEANKSYYIEAVWKEGGGGDYADVAWRKVGDTFAAQALPFIQGNVLETLAPPGALTPPTITFTAPADNSSIDQTNVPVTLSATASAATGKTITKVEFYEQNVLLGQTNAAPYSITLTNLAEGAHKFFARATDSAGLATDTPVVNFSIGGLRKVLTLLGIDDNTSWKYDRSGDDLGVDWREPAFNDSAWPSGKALIADETTTTVEPIRTPISRFNDGGTYVKTFYFRSHFNFPNAITSGTKLTLRHVIDDGAVIYLNGHEINRLGIASDVVVDATTDAAGHENKYEGPFDIPTTWLQTGDNVIAAEVHQSGGSSSDMVFGLELTATIPAVTQTLFAIDDVTSWKYDRSGDDLGVDWREPVFNDSAWPAGKTLIADETTTTVEPIRTPISRFNDGGTYVKTFYFRTHFNFPGEIPQATLKLRHAIDDGGVFYLNGKEVHRFGIAQDVVVDATTDAGGHENKYEGPYDIAVTNLVTGDNVFAVEIHQSGGSSSDMVFGAELVGTFFPAGDVTPPPTNPKLTVTRTATGISISWIDGGKLQSADKVEGPYTTISPDASNPFVVDTSTGVKFFRVLK